MARWLEWRRLTVEIFRGMKRESDRKCVNHARVHASAQSFDRCGARGRDSWCWPKGARLLGTRMYRKNPVKCSACIVARKIETDCFCRNLPISNDPVVRISRTLAKKIVHKPREWSITKNLNFDIGKFQQYRKRFTANYENRLCQNFIRTVLTEGI